ncbi:phosphoribosylanthranilate isomerase [Anaerobacillus alkaliphilus]|uniref:N-(5'-phosphoribosyl)anthranilate isomerase n=1 Tax=Anaerobacillus alkaliphilus TaxID=1548597 RepID=A0A4Q0VWE1_9BACI|nr:phosphoribosylanthranilate isomerase [Anaerobacillus alkaliphilus]RXJ03954.1 phosphoribosylanthranilate isomerase [Anaerobacillus alkaliphilus]
MRPLLKYCGNHSLNDVIVTAKSRADYLGFVFAPSKRCVTAQQVSRWLKEVEVSQKIVGVFVNATLREIEEVMEEVSLDVIQCHGEEPPEFVTTLKEKYQKNVWKVIHHSKSGLQTMQAYRHKVDGFVIDSKVAGQRGGTGVQFDWQVIPEYQQEAKNQQVPCFIAGGINVSTITQLLEYNPIGIDLSSGIERDGRKSTTIKNNFEERLFL